MMGTSALPPEIRYKLYIHSYNYIIKLFIFITYVYCSLNNLTYVRSSVIKCLLKQLASLLIANNQLDVSYEPFHVNKRVCLNSHCICSIIS